MCSSYTRKGCACVFCWMSTHFFRLNVIQFEWLFLYMIFCTQTVCCYVFVLMSVCLSSSTYATVFYRLYLYDCLFEIRPPQNGGTSLISIIVIQSEFTFIVCQRYIILRSVFFFTLQNLGFYYISFSFSQ